MSGWQKKGPGEVRIEFDESVGAETGGGLVVEVGGS